VDHQGCQRLALSFFAVALVCLPIVASAKNSHVQIKGPGLAPGAKPAGATLSRDALRNCVEAQQRINANADALDREELANSEEVKRLDQLSTEIDKRSEGIDRQRESSVEAYNELVDRHARAVEQYNASVPRYNLKSHQHYKEVLDFDAKCAHKAYYKGDLRAISDAVGKIKK
jgi:hypothetical protein